MSLRERRRWQIHGDDQLALLEIGIALRRVARQPVEVAHRHRTLTFRAAHAHDGIERRERYRHVRGMHRDAIRARAEDGVDAVVALERGAARAWMTLVAGAEGGVVKVVAARALQEVAADRRHVA